MQILPAGWLLGLLFMLLAPVHAEETAAAIAHWIRGEAWRERISD